MRLRILLVVLILLFSSMAYSDEYPYSQGYSESYGGYGYSHTYNDEDMDFEEFDEDDFEKHKERFKESPEFEKEFPKDFKGPGGCKSKEECMEYCMKHEDECKRMMEHKPEMYQMRLEFRKEVFEEYQQPYMMKREMMHPMMYFPKDVDPIEMVMSKVFEKAKGMDQKEFMKYCPDAEAMVNEAIKRLNEQGIQLKASCEEINEYLKHCKEENRCGKMKGHMFFEEDISCDNLNEETLFNRCKERHEKFQQEQDFVREQCEKHLESFQNNEMCKQTVECDEQEFIDKCKNEHQQRCNEQAQQFNWDQSAIDSCTNSHDCNAAWNFQEENCGRKREMCDKERFLNECIERSKKGFETASQNIEENCRHQASKMYEGIKQGCEMQDKMHSECLERSSQVCEIMQKAIDQCSTITEDQIKAKMIKHARFMCDVMSKMHEEGMESVMAKMMIMKEDMPEEIKPVLDAEVKELYDIEKELEAGEKDVGGFFAKIKRFLGIISEKEKQEASELEQNANKIDESIQRLSELSEQVTDVNLKAALLLQIENLKQEKEKIKSMAEKKKKGGLLSGFAVLIKKFEL